MTLDRIPRDQLHEIITQLDQAMYNHREWHRLIVKTLVCKLPIDNNDLDHKAYKQCRFGQWYYSDKESNLRKSSEFVAVGKEHEHLHTLTVQLLDKSAKELPIPISDYDNFNNSLERLQLEMSALKRKLEELIYNRDALTGAISRLNMLNILREHQALLKRGVYQHSSVVMVDLDHFSQVNNTYGHPAGDVALMETTKFLINNLRPYDKVFRYGGEEFLLLIQDADLEKTDHLINRIREGLAHHEIKLKEKEVITLTASFGVAPLDSVQDVESSIDHADQVLYEAKSSGRNCVKVWAGEESPG